MAFFEYHCYEGEDSADAELWHHTHQPVKILQELDKSEGDCAYRVEFQDGFEATVFEDEVLSSVSEYERPDYTPTKGR